MPENNKPAWPRSLPDGCLVWGVRNFLPRHTLTKQVHVHIQPCSQALRICKKIGGASYFGRVTKVLVLKTQFITFCDRRKSRFLLHILTAFFEAQLWHPVKTCLSKLKKLISNRAQQEDLQSCITREYNCLTCVLVYCEINDQTLNSCPSLNAACAYACAYCNPNVHGEFRLKQKRR